MHKGRQQRLQVTRDKIPNQIIIHTIRSRPTTNQSSPLQMPLVIRRILQKVACSISTRVKVCRQRRFTVWTSGASCWLTRKRITRSATSACRKATTGTCLDLKTTISNLTPSPTPWASRTIVSRHPRTTPPDTHRQMKVRRRVQVRRPVMVRLTRSFHKYKSTRQVPVILRVITKKPRVPVIYTR